MAENFVQDGDVLDLTAPTGGVVAGMAYLIGALLVIALGDAAEGAPFRGKTGGVFSGLPKTSAQAWTVGARLQWNDTTKVFTTATTTGLFPVGVAAEAASNPSDSGTVRLDGVSVKAL